MVRLALPIVIVQVGIMLMGVTDSVMMGRVSDAGLAAVALGNLYFFGVAVFGLGVLMALDPVISQAVGAGDEPAIQRGLQRGVLLAAAITVPVSALLLPAEPLLIWLKQPAEVAAVAADYARVSVAGVFPFYLFTVYRQTLQAMHRTGAIVVTILLANALNVGFNWVLIFGHLGFPAMGAVGASWATAASRWAMALGLLALGWRELRAYHLPWLGDALSLRPLLRMVKLGAPIGGAMFLEYGVFAVVGLLMGSLGSLAMAAHQIALNLASLTFMVPMGVAGAATVRVGHAIGRGDPSGIRRAAAAALLMGASFMVCTAVLMILAPRLLARVYTTQEDLIALAATLIPLAGTFQVFDGIQVVSTGILRGAADTRTPLVVAMVGFWFVGLPISVVLLDYTSLGPAGLWWGLVVGLAAVALILLARLHWRLRQHLVRVNIEDDRALARSSPADAVS